MQQFEDNQLIFSINKDIDKCLSEIRVDKQITLFIHIYAQLDTKMRADEILKEFYDNLTKKFFNYQFRQELEFYYALTLDNEEGRLLFDPQINYNPKYDMRNFLPLYDEISKIQNGIAINLGYIKRKIISSGSIDVSGF